VLATLIRLLGDFDRAEEALHDAFTAAMNHWPKDGVPRNPRAWLVSAGRFKAIDQLRKRKRFDEAKPDLAANEAALAEDAPEIEDDRLRLVFTCCHPALPPEQQTALTLREICGLTTEEIARCYLTTAPTIAKRIVRAKTKIRAAKIPYEVPERAELPDRLASVLQVVYLIFTEGYSASAGPSLTRADLCQEAIRLARLVVELLPEPEALGLLALLLLQDSRREARTGPKGELILLEHQDRTRWNRSLIDEGQALLERAFHSHGFGPYTLQAAIAAVHADARVAAETDWPQIVGLYDVLLRANPSPVIELNRAVAIAMTQGPKEALARIDAILERGDLQSYALAHSARADMCRRLGKTDDAIAAYRQALALAKQEPARQFLRRRLKELAAGDL